MFKHILLPIDGSEISAATVPKVLEFARGCGARVTAIHVVIDFQIFSARSEMLADTRGQYEREGGERARALLADISAKAGALGVPCDTIAMSAERPYSAIIGTAQQQGCDLICMASHGRHGVQSLLLGSETQKVLAHSHIPVLVYR